MKDPTETDFSRPCLVCRNDGPWHLRHESLPTMYDAPDHAYVPSRFQTLMRRTWTDPYPDELTVSLVLTEDTGKPCIVFTSQAAFLDPKQALEVASFVTDCYEEALKHELND